MNSPSRTCLSVGGPLPPPPPPPISTSTWKEDYCASLPAVSTLLLEPSFVCELFLSVRHSHQACAPFNGKWYRLQEVSSEPKTNFCDLEDTQFLAETHPYTHTTHTHTHTLSLSFYTHTPLLHIHMLMTYLPFQLGSLWLICQSFGMRCAIVIRTCILLKNANLT